MTRDETVRELCEGIYRQPFNGKNARPRGEMVKEALERAYDAGAARLAEVEAENGRLREALLHIANHPHNAYDRGGVESPTDLQYSTGVTDGHRCAAQHARDVLRTVADRLDAHPDRDRGEGER